MNFHIHNITGIKSTKKSHSIGDRRFFVRTLTIYYEQNGHECEQEIQLYSDKWYRLEIKENDNANSATPVAENV